MQDIQTIPLSEETQRRYLNYALSVITSRALPDVRDGLKPVQRRILYTMFHDLHLHARRALPQVRQGRRRRDGQLPPARRHRDLRRAGAHGAGLLAALPARRRAGQLRLARRRRAPRRCATPSASCSRSRSSCSTSSARRRSSGGPTTTARRSEPVVLPARVPNLLVNGAQGIAVGMATSIPPHNLGEVVEACIALVDDAALESKDLLKFVKGPDFPTGGQLLASQARAQGDLRDRPGLAQAARRVEGRGAQGAQADADARHHLDPVRADQAVDRREDRRDHPRAQAAAAGRRAR